VLNSDAEVYGGGNFGNGGNALNTEDVYWMGRPHSLIMTVPPLAGVVLKLAHD